MNMQTSGTKTSNNHLIGLDLLRLFAASIVVLNHFGIFSSARPDVGEPFAYPALNFFSEFGWVGVEIFFVISGFVIPLTARSASAGEFVTRRLVRVLPALWICSLLGFAVLAISGQPVRELLLPLFHSMVLSPKGPYIDGVVWTLVVEAVFYALIWAVLLGRWFGRLDWIATGLGFASAAFLTVSGLTDVCGNIPSIGDMSAVFDRFIFRILLLRHGVFFALGIFIWSGFTYGFSRRRCGLIAIMGAFCLAEIAFQYWSTSPQKSVHAMALPMMLWAAAICTLFASVTFGRQIVENLNGYNGLFKKLGLLTYPLYLNHYTLGRVMAYFMATTGVPRPASFAVAMTIIIASSWYIMIFPEPALQSIFRRQLSARLNSPLKRQL